MDRFIIAAGGTGAMCARAFIYMAAAGCGDQNDTYHILLMDKDKESDAVTACENLMTDYEAMRQQLGQKPGTFTFPKIQVHKWNFTDEITDEYTKQTGKPADALKILTLNKLLNPNGDPMMAQVLSTMYTTEELNTDLEKGFYGHPNIGAPVFDYVRQRFLSTKVTRADGEVRVNTFMAALQAVLTKGSAHVYLMGSLFGGTGATVIPNVVLALRSLNGPKDEPWGQQNLVLGGSVVMPYFKLPVRQPDSVEALNKVAPADTKFEGQTKDALSYYHESKLLSQMMNLLLLGTSTLDVTSELYARGGVQNQHFHIVNLLAAAAANRFFKNELGSMADAVKAVPVTPLGELLVWKASPQEDGTFKTLTDGELGLTGEYKTLVKFLRYSVVVGYYMRLRFDQDPTDMKGWNEIRGTCKQMPDTNGKLSNPKTITTDQIKEFYQKPVENAGAICKGFIQFIYDVALSGYDWSGYHEKDKEEVEASDGQKYYRYKTTDKVIPTEAAAFGARWVDLANLKDLKDLLEVKSLNNIMSQKTLNSICSYQPQDPERPSVTENNYPGRIAEVYETALDKLGLVKGILGRLKKDDVYFCEIYDKIYECV